MTLKIIEKFFVILAISAIIGNTYILFKRLQFEKTYEKAENLHKITGIVISEKEEKNYYEEYILKSKTKGTYNKKFIIYVRKGQALLKYGDKIKFRGEYLKPEGRRNYKGFDYQEYLKTKGIYGSFKIKEDITIIGENQVSKIFTFINEIREKIISNTNELLPKETKEIFLGLLIGKKDLISEEDIQSFKLSNMSHILSVSGMHTSYIILGLTYILNSFSKRRRYIITIIFLIFFMFLTNFVPSVVRAVTMAIIAIIAKLLYKKNNYITSIFLSLLILLIYNPYLIKDIGLILSFLGTLGIILFSNKISLKLEKKLNKKASNILAVSISAQILIFPITILNFNIFSLSFILSSFICTALVGVIIVYGFINIFLSFFLLKTAKFFSTVLNLLLQILILSSKYIAKVEFLNFTIKTPSIIVIILYYLCVIVIQYISNLLKRPRDELKMHEKKLIMVIHQTQKKKIITLLVMFIVFISMYNAIYKLIPKDFKVHFIDVGQGDSSLIISPKGKTILIDAGEDKDILLPYLLDRRINKLNYVLISHFDSDHVIGLFQILQELDVKKVIISKQGEDSENFQEFIKIVKEKKIELIVVKKRR